MLSNNFSFTKDFWPSLDKLIADLAEREISVNEYQRKYQELVKASLVENDNPPSVEACPIVP